MAHFARQGELILNPADVPVTVECPCRHVDVSLLQAFFGCGSPVFVSIPTASSLPLRSVCVVIPDNDPERGRWHSSPPTLKPCLHQLPVGRFPRICLGAD